MVAKSKTFDCVAMKHEIQERIAQRTQGMTPAQLMEFTRREAEAFRAESAARPKRTFSEIFAEFDREQESRLKV